MIDDKFYKGPIKIMKLADHSSLPFARSAHIYDDLYQKSRDYKNQAAQINKWIRLRKPDAASLLDVACGTGLHLLYLNSYYGVAGIDINPTMVEIAKYRNPGIHVWVRDMRDFNIGKTFDAIICMFSSITYADTVEGLNMTLANYARHLNPNGICIVEPFVTPEVWRDGGLGLRTAESKSKKVAMLDRAERLGRRIRREIIYVVATPDRIEQIHEEYTFPLFTHEEHEGAFRSAGFDVEFDKKGFKEGRGMYFGVLT